MAIIGDTELVAIEIADDECSVSKGEHSISGNGAAKRRASPEKACPSARSIALNGTN